MKFTITKFQTCFMTCKLPDTHICNGEEVTDNQTAKVPAIEFHAVCDAVQITVKCPWRDIVASDSSGAINLATFFSNIGVDNMTIDFTGNKVLLRRA